MKSVSKTSAKEFAMGKNAPARTSKAHHTARGTNAPVLHSAKDNNCGSCKKATGKSFKSMGVC